MNIEITDLDMILNYLETTSLEPHDDYSSEFTYKDQKILYKYIKQLQQENKQLKDNWNELKEWIDSEIENQKHTTHWEVERKMQRQEEKQKLKNIHKTYGKKPKGKCPKCKRYSLFFTNEKGEIFCVRCDEMVGIKE